MKLALPLVQKRSPGAVGGSKPCVVLRLARTVASSFAAARNAAAWLRCCAAPQSDSASEVAVSTARCASAHTVVASEAALRTAAATVTRSRMRWCPSVCGRKKAHSDLGRVEHDL